MERTTLTNEDKDILDLYGVRVKDNRILAMRNRPVKDPEGNYVDWEEPTEVSNFGCRTLLSWDTEDGLRYLLELANVHGRSVAVEFTPGHLVNRAQFHMRCLAQGNFVFTGTDADFQHLLRMLMDQAVPGEVLTTLGWNTKANAYFFNNGVLDTAGQFHPYDATGVVRLGGHQFYVPSAASRYADDALKFPAQKRMLFVENDTSFEQVSTLIGATYGPAGFVALSWAVGCLYRDLVLQEVKGFPLLHLYGEASTGKSSLLTTLVALLGGARHAFHLHPDGDLSLRKLAKFHPPNGTFLEVEEYMNNAGPEADEFLKAMWDSVGHSTRSTTGEVISTSPVRHGTAISSNNYITDPALFSRTVILEMTKSIFDAQERADWSRLQKMVAAGISGVMRELIQNRPKVAERFMKEYSTAMGDLNSMLGERASSASRMAHNYGVLLAIARIIGMEQAEQPLRDALKYQVKFKL